ncbi:MAG: argininosuccinate synthase [Halobacteria archaeon]
MTKTAVLAFSGGLDTSVCVPLLRDDDHYGYDEVIGVTVDVGQPEDDMEEAYDRAHILDEHRVIGASEEFVDELIFPLVKANGSYEGYPMGTSVARPIIARHCLRVAEEVGADALAHGCTGKGNDQLRFEAVWRAGDFEIIAPMREMNLTREWEIEYANEHGLEVEATKEEPWSIDSNIWSRSIEGGEMENPSNEPPEEIFKWTASPDDAPEGGEVIEIEFEGGVPVALNGERKDGVELITTLNEIAGEHGVGRNDMMEDRVLGLKVREVYEHPAATTLLKAHADLESLVFTRAQTKFKSVVENEWSDLAYAGLVDEPLFDDLNAYVDSSQDAVNGTVRVKLHKGTARVVGRESEDALYSEDMVSFDTGGVTDDIDQTDAVGFAKYHGIQGRMHKSLDERDG